MRNIFYYHLSSSTDGIPALKSLDSHSMKHIKRGKAILSDLKYLMSVVEVEAQGIGLNTEGIQTQLQASRIFEQFKEAVYKHHIRSKRKETFKKQTWE